jgi:hypothetical protein
LTSILSTNNDDDIRVDFLWLPAFGAPSGSLAQLDAGAAPSPNGPDPRSRVWWNPTSSIGTALAGLVGGGSPLYDRILMYDPGRVWDTATNSPGMPDWLASGGFNQATAEAEIAARRPGCAIVDTP